MRQKHVFHPSRIPTHSPTHEHSDTYTIHTYRHTHTLTHTQIHKYTNAQIHTHALTLALSFSRAVAVLSFLASLVQVPKVRAPPRPSSRLAAAADDVAEADDVDVVWVR